ncbi:hypothetical protein CCO03_08650 [Comamonas serinivorans]|uniref:FCP1 homology domain-containing protein n=1 Tax=Comamonas serinivorans TaxID=1082851 RepID=A0A1Y0EMB7_9BURK|nr:HAD domain-containing protein [Comamonas serinivorans]ARU04736.1 hypothetical protein CCO03_08650 [Comamonas serinivorans]
MRKILFLDVDGVLNSVKSCAALGGYPHELTSREGFDWIAIKLLQRLCDSSGVQIVMSSAWRAWNKPEDFAKAFDLPVIDSTPRLHTKRGEEIQAWLDANDDIEAYVILDDDSDMLDSQQERFIKTNAKEGLTWTDFSKVCALFGESPFSGAARDREWKAREDARKPIAILIGEGAQ